ncbi:hypothetical protein [Indiicoccus explosivorum]|uniref:hypothetical protein n=1 Tax=Indiicoccus explosivorum TaxID=1917864 RepID=UPI000B4390CB|nr:hypothetical protein [Indiicoccus explosivorum]
MGKFAVAPSLVLLLVLLTACRPDTAAFSDFYGKEAESVTEIAIIDGRTGEEVRSSDSEVIDAFMNDIEDIQFIPEQNQEAREGYLYAVELYEGDEETFRFTPSSVNDVYYSTKPDIQPIIENYYYLLSDRSAE